MRSWLYNMKIEIKTNLPFGGFDYNVLLTILQHFDITLIFDDSIETFVNPNNVYFKMDTGGETLTRAVNALYRSLYNIDHAKEFFINGNTQ